MHSWPKVTLSACLLLVPVLVSAETAVSFSSESYAFNSTEVQLILDTVEHAEREVRALLPTLPEDISLNVSTLDRDLSGVGGVTGSADDPHQVTVLISTSYEGGMGAAIRSGLSAVLYHEFHHLARGWTIRENKFGPGIHTAAVNEGLANVFSEIYTDTAFEGNAFPANASAWLEEISSLPADASYSDWMVEHPDGRRAIGYKAGSYLVRTVLDVSGLSILELSEMPVDSILNMYKQEH